VTVPALDVLRQHLEARYLPGHEPMLALADLDALVQALDVMKQCPVCHTYLYELDGFTPRSGHRPGCALARVKGQPPEEPS
jgi:hypothetical protein